MSTNKQTGKLWYIQRAESHSATKGLMLTVHITTEMNLENVREARCKNSHCTIPE